MDNDKKLQILMELDSTTDWQALIKKKGSTSVAQTAPNKPTRKLTKTEKKRRQMEEQMEKVREKMKAKNIQTVVYNNPDSFAAKSKKSAKDKEPEEIANEEGNEFDMRQTRHEIIKFSMTDLKSKDLEDAETSLAISLGAKPNKRVGINYKELQKQRKKMREDEKEKESSSMKPDLKSISKKQPPRKGNNKKMGKESKDRSSKSRSFSKSKSRPRPNKR